MDPARRRRRRALLVMGLALGGDPAAAATAPAGSGSGDVGFEGCGTSAGLHDVEAPRHASASTPPPRCPHPVAAVTSRAFEEAMQRAERDAKTRCRAPEATETQLKAGLRAGLRVWVTMGADDGAPKATWFEPPIADATFRACLAQAFATMRIPCFAGDDVTFVKTLGGTSECPPFPVPEVQRALRRVDAHIRASCTSLRRTPRRAYATLRAARGTTASVWFSPPVEDAPYRTCLSEAFSELDVGCFAGDDVTLTTTLHGGAP
ncbi:MAG: hypothetical protein AAF928_03345 [Myxococcota bacterium]